MAEGLWPEESRVAAGLAANAVTMELVTMLQSRGVLADADAFAVMTGAIESLRRMAQEQPHQYGTVWDAAQQLVLQQAARFNGGGVWATAFVGPRTSGAAHGCFFRGLAAVTIASSPETKGMPHLLGE